MPDRSEFAGWRYSGTHLSTTRDVLAPPFGDGQLNAVRWQRTVVNTARAVRRRVNMGIEVGLIRMLRKGRRRPDVVVAHAGGNAP